MDDFSALLKKVDPKEVETLVTLIADAYRAAGQPIGTEPHRWCVTASLRIDYLAPTPVDRPVELRARVREASGRKRIVECTVRSGGCEVARAEVVAVEVPAGWGGPVPWKSIRRHRLVGGPSRPAQPPM